MVTSIGREGSEAGYTTSAQLLLQLRLQLDRLGEGLAHAHNAIVRTEKMPGNSLETCTGKPASKQELRWLLAGSVGVQAD